MIKPTPGELLAGISAGLRAAVLPELADGHGRRQLKAALHALARLERAADAQPAQLHDDNEDMAGTLRSVIDALHATDPSGAPSIATFSDNLACLRSADNSCAAQRSLHAALQALLITVDDWLHEPARADCTVCRSQRDVLARLFSRMVDRELAASAMAGEAP